MSDERQRQFEACREYLIDFNQTLAMIRAGYSPSTAKKSAHRVFNLPHVQVFLKKLMDEHHQKQNLSAEMVLEELRRLALSNIADYYQWNPTKKKYVLKPLNDLTREQTAAIAKYEPGRCYTLYNKDGALDKLAKYFKLYSEVDSVVTNFMMMPEVKIGGKVFEFKIGKPAPKRPEQKKP